MTVQVVLVHGVRTSATMWRAQIAHLNERGVPATAVDLPGHGPRKDEAFTLEGAFETIDTAVRTAAASGPVLLVGHSMGGLLGLEYVGAIDAPPVAAYIGASCTTLPRGASLGAYRLFAKGIDALPRRGAWLTERHLALTLPSETRDDFGAGGFAYDTQDTALASLTDLDLLTAITRIQVPVWFVNGQFDQLRANERLFLRALPQAELIVVPRTTHLVTAMRPRVFNAVLDLAIATIDEHASTAMPASRA